MGTNYPPCFPRAHLRGLGPILSAVQPEVPSLPYPKCTSRTRLRGHERSLNNGCEDYVTHNASQRPAYPDFLQFLTADSTNDARSALRPAQCSSRPAHAASFPSWTVHSANGLRGSVLALRPAVGVLYLPIRDQVSQLVEPPAHAFLLSSQPAAPGAPRTLQGPQRSR